jgi:hypothetical protein
MKTEIKFIALFVFYVFSFYLGRLTAPQNLTYYSNAQVVIKCVEVLNQCAEGYGRTLDLLKESNGLLDEVMK